MRRVKPSRPDPVPAYHVVAGTARRLTRRRTVPAATVPPLLAKICLESLEGRLIHAIGPQEPVGDHGPAQVSLAGELADVDPDALNVYLGRQP